MHIERPATDQHLDLTILVNNQPATEYVLPGSSNSPTDGYIDTYIAVEPGSRLTAKWTFTGSVLHGNFDLVADGTLCREARIEGDSVTGAVKHVKRTGAWNTGLDCPTPEDWTSSEPSPHLFEGELIVAEMVGDEGGQQQESGGGDRPGIGSLVVVVSVNQHTLDNYHDPEKSIEMGSWRARKGEEVRQAEIPPEYVLELRLLSDDKIKAKRSLLQRRAWQATRFGTKPWGKFCFFYRSLESIQRAGGLARGEDEVLQVEAWDGQREFEFVEPPKKGASKKRNVAGAAEDGGEDGMFVTGDTPERRIKQERQESVVSQRVITPPPKKKAKLGGALFGSAEKPKEDVVAVTTERDDDEGGILHDDHVETPSAELNLNEDGFDATSTPHNSTKKLDSFNKKDYSTASTSVPINDAAAVWNWPGGDSIPSAQNLRETSANAAVMIPPSKRNHSLTANHTSPLSNSPTFEMNNNTSTPIDIDIEPIPGMDKVKIPTILELKNEIDDDGSTPSDLDDLFHAAGPFHDPHAARAEFDLRISKIAERRIDGRFHLYPDENISRAELAKTVKPKAKSSPKESTKARGRYKAAAKSRSLFSPPPFSPSRRYGSAASSPTPAAAAAALTGKIIPPPPPSPSRPTTPVRDSKVPRTASATPSGVGIISSATARKQKLLQLKRDLAARRAREREVRERVRGRIEREEAEIRKLELELVEADGRLRDLEDEAGEGEEGEMEGEGEEDSGEEED